MLMADIYTRKSQEPAILFASVVVIEQMRLRRPRLKIMRIDFVCTFGCTTLCLKEHCARALCRVYSNLDKMGKANVVNMSCAACTLFQCRLQLMKFARLERVADG